MDAEGFGMEASWLEGTPFPDDTVPGLVLLFGIGGGMPAAALTAVAGSPWAAPAAVGMGAPAIALILLGRAHLGRAAG